MQPMHSRPNSPPQQTKSSAIDNSASIDVYVFMMDKYFLCKQVLERLGQNLFQIEQAARQAHETAIHKENIAENKYDTLGLEAAYLASGQARRADAIRQTIHTWQHFHPQPHNADKGIDLGAVIRLINQNKQHQTIFLGPIGGSMQLVCETEIVQVISTETPLAKAMLGKFEGDEISIEINHKRQDFEILSIQ